MGSYPHSKNNREIGDSTILNSLKLADIAVIEISEINRLLESGQYFKVK